MTKKRASLTLRKPGQGESPPSIRDIESFVDGDSTEPATITPISNSTSSNDVAAVPSFRRANKSIVKRKTKADRRRTTVYMNLPVANQLAEYCTATDREMSDVVNEAISRFFETIPVSPNLETVTS